jgi:hypothetical protein
MLFSKVLTVPANTAKVSYQEDRLKITKGKIKRIDVYFPWGCAGLVGVQIIRHTWQIFPITRGEWVIGNELLHSYNYNFDIRDDPIELVIRSYNTDDTYGHSPIIGIEILRGETSLKLDKLLSEL